MAFLLQNGFLSFFLYSPSLSLSFSPLFLTSLPSLSLLSLPLQKKTGADPNISDEQGRTALRTSSGSGQTEPVKLLLRHHADPEIPHMFFFCFFIIIIYYLLFNLFLFSFFIYFFYLFHSLTSFVFSSGSSGSTPLQFAAQEGHVEICQALLEAGASYLKKVLSLFLFFLSLSFSFFLLLSFFFFFSITSPFSFVTSISYLSFPLSLSSSSLLSLREDNHHSNRQHNLDN